MTRDPVIAHCEAILRRSSATFARAARLLPRRVREGATQLYAWCRYCDDVIDNQVLGHGQRPATNRHEALQAIARLRAMTAAAIAGETMEEPVFVGLQRVVGDHGVPAEQPFVLLDGLAMDVEGCRYETIDDLAVYCYRVAGMLGVMATHVMGTATPPVVSLAGTLGTAFQMTNIARDVMDDAAAGRVYLPLAWLSEAGVPPDEVAAPRHREPVAGVVARLLDDADERYRQADLHLRHLPFRLAWPTATARGTYAAIGQVVRRRRASAWDRRAVVGRAAQASWIVRGLLAAALR